MLTGSSQSASRGRVVARTVSRRRSRPPRPTHLPFSSASGRAASRASAANPTALRLVGEELAPAPPAHADPIQGTHDPRWVLAVRVAEKLEGTLLRPEHRQQLVRLGRMMGLNVFDCNLVIAIVQDQARRGQKPGDCPTAGEAQLCMVPLPRRVTFLQTLRRRPAMLIAGILATLIMIEMALLNWLV